MATETTRKVVAQIASHIPGRLRLKLAPGQCSAEEVARISEQLKARPGVDTVAANRNAGSLTVNYDSSTHSMSGILGVLQDLDVVVGQVSGGKGGASGAPGVEGAPTFLEAVEDLNQRLSAATGTDVNLKTALPLALAGIGVWSVLRQGLKLERVPALFFFWGAFDIFVRLHPPRRPESH